MDDFSKLDETKHMLEWVCDGTYQQIRNEIEALLAKQVTGSKIKSFCVTSSPDWLTRGLKQDNNPDKVILKGSGVAFEFSLVVIHDEGEETLSGVWTMVGYQLNTQSRSFQQWLDINGTLAEFGKDGELMIRVYLE